MWFWNRREVYHGFDMARMSEVRETLKTNHIKYDYRVLDLYKGSRTRESLGSNGRSCDFRWEYYVYVSRKDYETAMIILK